MTGRNIARKRRNSSGAARVAGRIVQGGRAFHDLPERPAWPVKVGEFWPEKPTGPDGETYMVWATVTFPAAVWVCCAVYAIFVGHR